MTNFLLKIERWTRDHLRSKRTRRIEEERKRYMQEYRDISQYLQKLQSASREHETIVQALERRMGL